MKGNPDYWRQLDIFKPDDKTKILIVGAGSVGSYVALTLAKMGISDLTVVDFDKVEPHNLPNQFYKTTDIGRPKVEALKDIIKEFTNTEITAINDRIENYLTKDKIFDIVILAVDNMKTRKQIFEKYAKHNIYVKYLIDIRTSAENFRIYTIQPVEPEDAKFYESELYSDDEASELPCTAQNIIYTVVGVAAITSSTVKKILSNQKINRFYLYDYITEILMNR